MNFREAVLASARALAELQRALNDANIDRASVPDGDGLTKLMEEFQSGFESEALKEGPIYGVSAAAMFAICTGVTELIVDRMEEPGSEEIH